MAIYRRTNLGNEYDQLSLQEELERIERALGEFDVMKLAELHREPAKRRSGMTVLADGTDWNPGAGQGVYTYYAGTWHKLG